MNWDIKKIEETLNYILDLISKDPDDKILKLDYNSLLSIIKPYNNELYNQYYSIFPIQDIDLKTISQNQKDFYLDSEINIKLETKNIAKFINKMNYKQINYPLLFNPPKANKELQGELTNGFLKEYDTNLYNMYRELTNGNIQETNKLNHYYGICYSVITTQENFIIYVNNYLHNCNTLIHELAHIQQLKDLKQDKKINYMISTYREAYPIFLDLLFNDYCYTNIENNKNKKIFLYSTGMYYNNLTMTTTNPNDYDSIHKENMDLYISHLLGIYMYSLYKKDKKEFTLFNNFFQSSLCNITDSKLSEQLSIDNITNTCLETIKEYNNQNKRRIKHL